VDGAPETKDLDVPTPLFIACQGIGASSAAHIEIIKLLLSRGADPNRGCRLRAEARKRYDTFTHPSIGPKDQSNWCPLHLACAFPDNDIVGLLLTHGANPNATTEDNITPLMLACQALRLRSNRYRYALPGYEISDTVVGKATVLLLLKVHTNLDFALPSDLN